MSSTSPEDFDFDAPNPSGWMVAWALLGTHVLTAFWYAERAKMGLAEALVLSRTVRMRVTCGGQYGPLVSDGQTWRLVRSIGLHGDALHLAVNAVSVLVIARLLEPWIGSTRFLWWFGLCGLCGSLASHGAGLTQSDGASGGAFGLLGALAVMAFRRRDALDPQDRWMAVWALPGFIVLNLILSLAIPVVDFVGHVGGLIPGLFLGAFASGRPGPWTARLEGLAFLALLAIALGGPIDFG